ncbi:hypothetical protein Celaphus_00012476, partial [Cervus elaphus hippelaphus]
MSVRGGEHPGMQCQKWQLHLQICSEMHILYQAASRQAVQPDEVSAKCQLPQRGGTRGDTKA